MKAFAAVFLPLAIAYATALWWCIEMWWLPEGYYSHGLLVPPLMAVLLWRQRREWGAVPARSDPRGFYLLAPALLLHLAGAALMIDSLSAASLLLAAPGAVWLASGLRRLYRLAPVLGLLLFAVPLPIFVTGRIAFELKEAAVTIGLAVANAFGLHAVRDAALVNVPGQAEGLLVADACGGLRSLLAMLLLAWCLAFFTGPRNGGRRAVLVLAAGPFAVLVNALRIAALCWEARWYGTAFAAGWGHELANAVAWIVDLGLLLGCDAWLRRFAAGRAIDPVPAPAASGRLTASAVVLWLCALPLLALSCYRPFPESAGRAESIPADVGGFHLTERYRIPARYHELLGTADAVWRRYQDSAKVPVYVVAVFHEANWKSLHPPNICIEGSNMDIVATDVVPLGNTDAGSTVGRILARDRSDGRSYVSLFAYGARGLCTGSYWEFFRWHAPRALLRRSNAGFLLRVETFAGSDGPASAEARCRSLLQALLPAAQGLLP